MIGMSYVSRTNQTRSHCGCIVKQRNVILLLRFPVWLENLELCPTMSATKLDAVISEALE
jgi:hypothetical protein